MRILIAIIFLILMSCKSQQTVIELDSIIGIYQNKGDISYMLKLSENGEFYYSEQTFHHSLEFTNGNWRISNDTLILNSKTLNFEKDVATILTNGRWLELKELSFRIKPNKLLPIGTGKPKLKKKTE